MPASAQSPQAASTPLLQYLPVGSQCRGLLPCEKSGDFGLHFRLLGAFALDEQRAVRSGLLVPSLILSALEAGECGVALPLRFYELGLPVPERLRVFCKLSLPSSILPVSGGAVFANINLAYGPFNEAAAPAGARPTTVDVGGVLGGGLGARIHLGAAIWATLGEPRPQLHAGPELRLRLDPVTLFAQAQFQACLGAPLPGSPEAWGLVGTFGLSFSSDLAPTSAHVSVGHGDAPAMLLAVEAGLSYDVKVHARHGDAAAAMERRWDRWLSPHLYRMQLRRRGYYDPYPDEDGLLRDDFDHSVLGIVGVPDPARPGYILTPWGISIPVGASLEIRGDRPFIASPSFPGQVLSYIPLLALTHNGGALPRPIFDETYFARLEDERRREELAVQEELRQLDSPWAKAALNAAVGLLTEHVLLFLAAASPDTPDLATLRRQARLLPYRPGYEEYKGEIAETVLATYGSLLAPWAAGMLRTTATLTARELATGLSALRARGTAGTAGQAPRLLTRLAPRLNPRNYNLELRGLGSNLGNVEVRFGEAARAGAEVEHAAPALRTNVGSPARATPGPAAQGAAEHLQPPELAAPPISDKVRAHIYSGDVTKGKSRGWHYEPTGDPAQGTYVVESSRTAPDAHGVYEANVYIEGVKKNARSSFFPAKWSPAEVEQALEEAYRTRLPTDELGTYDGLTSQGIKVRMKIGSKGQLQTAYPVYRGGR
ncbi:MAG TPA: EndoU domain-containing protein [Pseudomonadota bacterium]|nr:EndoU domain-containing protein [Pseudomonadota bacterium]